MARGLRGLVVEVFMTNANDNKPSGNPAGPDKTETKKTETTETKPGGGEVRSSQTEKTEQKTEQKPREQRDQR